MQSSRPGAQAGEFNFQSASTSRTKNTELGHALEIGADCAPLPRLRRGVRELASCATTASPGRRSTRAHVNLV